MAHVEILSVWIAIFIEGRRQWSRRPAGSSLAATADGLIHSVEKA